MLRAPVEIHALGEIGPDDQIRPRQCHHWDEKSKAYKLKLCHGKFAGSCCLGGIKLYTCDEQIAPYLDECTIRQDY